MKPMRRVVQVMAAILYVAIATMSMQAPAHAGLVGTGEVIAQQEGSLARTQVLDALARDDVKAQLVALGVAPADLTHAVELDAVPFFPQERYQCGPAALATVLAWSGAAVTADQLVPQVYLPARQGSLQPELLAAARRYQRLPYVLEPDLAALLREVGAGHPVLVLQNLGLSWAPRWHNAVVVGYDLARDEVVLRSGAGRRACPQQSRADARRPGCADRGRGLCQRSSGCRGHAGLSRDLARHRGADSRRPALAAACLAFPAGSSWAEVR